MASQYNDLIGTIGEDEHVPVVSESSDSDLEVPTKHRKKKKKINNINRAEEFDPSFQFDDQDEVFESWGLEATMQMAKASRDATTLDEKIAKVRRQKKKQERTDDVATVESDEEHDVVETSSSEDEEEIKIDKVRIKEKRKKKKKGEVEQEEEMKDETIKYSSEVTSYDENMSFQDMNLSRPLLKALSTMKFTTPTPIQSTTIPVALLAKDVCACAATGTGKTAAFMLPILERLLYKPKQAPITRVLVLTPTRELAVQIYQVSRQLAQFTNVEISLSAGGLDIKAQEAALRLGPDIVIATPGRLIDHLHNAPNFNLESVEVLVLDEADRMLDEYFAEQMKEVIRLCSRTRQTMLFSATMTEKVQDLAAVSLKNPIKVFVNENTDVAMKLRQEFIRIRSQREGDREAVVAALVKRTFHDHCMVFIQTKKQAHRMHILLGLLGIRVGELHGNLSQAQRLESLKKFKEGELDVLLATDLAARGLDIHGVKTVINFTMPSTVQHYIHRVGRTARAGKAGRSVTLVGEQERRVLKLIVKRAQNPVKSRVVPAEVLSKFCQKIVSLEGDIKAIEKQEFEEKSLRAVENKVNKAQNLIDNEGEDRKRSWFQTHKDRKKDEAALRLGAISKLPNNHKKRKQMLQKFQPQNADERAQFDIQKAAAYATRVAKKQMKPKRLSVWDDEDKAKGPKVKKQKKSKTSSFADELTSTSGKAMRKMRSGPSFSERKELGMSGKKGRKPSSQRPSHNDKKDRGMAGKKGKKQSSQKASRGMAGKQGRKQSSQRKR